MTHVQLNEAKNQLQTLLEAALNGETIVISDGEQTVQLVPTTSGLYHAHHTGPKGVMRKDDLHELLSDHE